VPSIAIVVSASRAKTVLHPARDAIADTSLHWEVHHRQASTIWFLVPAFTVRQCSLAALVRQMGKDLIKQSMYFLCPCRLSIGKSQVKAAAL